MRRIGFVVNPIAGMGGRVGLKGTDGKVDEARERGAEPRAPDRAREALDSLATGKVELLVAGGEMGESAAREAGFDPEIVTDPSTDTTAEDTRTAVREFVAEDVDLILFVGGDGTAVDVAETLDELESKIPILGVPAGVKVYSAVFAVSPRTAGSIAATFDGTESREVNDIDEDEYREGEVHTELKAVVRVPVAEEVQSSKQLSGGTVETLAAGVAGEVEREAQRVVRDSETVSSSREAQSASRTTSERSSGQSPREPGTTYVLGPGSTVGAIKRELGFEGTPLGVDVWRATEKGGDVLVRDGSADEIESALGERNVVIVSPIGGQGFVFGRGNQQISPAVLRNAEIEVVASHTKLDETGVLRVDTGDHDLDDELRGWRKVRTGRFERRMMKVV